MFGSKPFGQSSSSAFVAQPVFGQTNNVSSNPFAPQPFGGMNSFGSQTVGSIFGGTSTGVFGPSPSLALGSGTPTFGASSGSAFGNSSSAFGGSSVFGQKPAFGSTTTQTSPFGSSFQQSQSQPAFGSNMLGLSTPFGAHPTSSFVASTPAFGSSTTSPPFGASAFGAPNTASAFSATSTSPFGNTATPSAPSFNLGSSPSFGQSTSTFGNTLFGTSSFGAQTSSFGAQTTTPAFGNPGFTQSTFGGQRGGSRVSAYSSTLETEGVTSTQPAGNLESISAMPVYKDKNHEELRWEDYQLGDKGGPAPASQITPVGGFGNIGFTSSSNPFTSSSTVASQTSFGTSNTSNFFGPKSSATPFGNMTQAFGGNTTPAFGQTSANPFTSSTTVASQTSFGTPNTSNFLVPTSSATPFGNTTQTFGGNTTPAFGQKSANPFTSSSTVASQTSFGTSNTSNFFSSTSSATLFGNTTQAFGRNSSPLFSSTTTPGFGTQSTFSPSSAQATTSAFGTSLSSGNTQLSSLFQSSTFTQNSTPFGQISSTFGQTAPAFAQTNLFSTPSTGFGNMFSSSPSLLNNNTTSGFGQPTPSHPTQFQSAQQPVFSSGLNVSNFGQAQSATTSGLGGTPGIFSNNTFGQPSGTQSSLVAQNPFGTLPTMPQISVGRTSNSPSVQYGISSLPVVEKPSPVRISSLLTSRHLTQRRLRMPVRKYSPQNDGPKVAFFTGDEETRNTLEVYASFVPRENPRALVTRLLEQQHSKAIGTPMHENGKDNSLENSHKDPANHDKGNQKKTNGVHNSVLTEKVNSYSTLTGDRADIEALIPKLRHSDYFTEPRVEELAAKERAEPGFCSHVNDFVVGRIGYGSIKFFGETDVRRLDLESLVQFNNREVIVYMDERKKPPVGQGLNNPAEVTLLNIKCFDKESGQQCTKGPRIEKYRKVLKRKAEDQGAEFVSYDPVKGEWKLRVSHFSKYAFGEEDESVVDVLSS